MFIAVISKTRDFTIDQAQFTASARRTLGAAATASFPASNIALARSSAGQSESSTSVATGVIFRDEGVESADQGELLGQMYVRLGPEFVKQLNGHFCFAIADPKDGSLYVARDHIGVEPLYFGDFPTFCVFSDSAKAVAAFGPKGQAGIDNAAVARFLCFNYNPGQSTLWEGVKKFPPGHYAEVVNGKFRLLRYWRPDFRDPFDQDEVSITEQLRDEIERAITIRAGDVAAPAVFVSGGLDSSTVLGVLAQHCKEPPRTYSYRCRGQGFDESHYARMMAESVGSRHTELEYQPENVDLMVDLVDSMNEPFCDIGINIATALLGREAAKDNRCVFTGDGGDELFGGHPIYEADKVARYTDMFPAPMMRAIGRVLTALPDSDKKKTLAVKLKRFGESLRFPRDLRTNRWRLYYLQDDLEKLLDEEALIGVSDSSLFADIVDTYRETYTADPLGQTLYSDYYTVVDFYLRRNDLNRSFGLQTRYPFLDPQLVDFCARIPSQFKIRGWFDSKYIMKKAIEPWLPHEIVYRKDKLGHSIPLKNWLRDNKHVREFVGDLISESRLRRRGLVRPEYVARMWDDHMASRVNNSHRLWSLAVLELWLDRHAGGVAEQGAPS